MYNFVTGMLVLICAVMSGVTIAEGKLFTALIYASFAIFFYLKLERQYLD